MNHRLRELVPAVRADTECRNLRPIISWSSVFKQEPFTNRFQEDRQKAEFEGRPGAGVALHHSVALAAVARTRTAAAPSADN